MENLVKHAILILFICLRLTCILTPFAAIDQKYRQKAENDNNEVAASNDYDFYSNRAFFQQHPRVQKTVHQV